MITYSSIDAIQDIPGTDYDALKARFAELAGVVDAVGAERKALADEIKIREKAVKVGLRIGAMDPADKAMAAELMGSDRFLTAIGVPAARPARSIIGKVAE